MRERSQSCRKIARRLAMSGRRAKSDGETHAAKEQMHARRACGRDLQGRHRQYCWCQAKRERRRTLNLVAVRLDCTSTKIMGSEWGQGGQHFSRATGGPYL